MKIVKTIGALIVLAGVFAIGYWRGQSDPKADHESAASSHSAGETVGSSQSMAGHDMAPPAVNVSPERQQLMGIRTATAEIRPMVQRIRTVGIVTYDETRIAQVFSKVEGWIEQLLVNYTGTLVRKGQPLFTLYSPDLVATQEEYLLALKAKQTLGSSSIKEVSAGSESLLESAHRRLSLWDISEEQIRDLEKTGKPKRSLTFYSPISGFVLKKEAVQGMRVMPDKELYTIADLSDVWVNADIYEYELAQVRVGQTATIRVATYPARDFIGKVSWIAPVLDEKTRTAKVRLEFPNRDFLLKPEMYANAEIDINAGRKLAVPDEAVLDSGLRKVVFLDKGGGRFEPTEVEIGNKFDGYYEVLAGLSPGERILASASFLLDSESRLKEAMGAMAGMPGMDMGNVQTAAAPTTEKKAGDLVLSIETQPSKPQVGENVVRLRIRDAKGNPVRDATVSFLAAMNMPGMAPVKATPKHTKDGIYEAALNFAMAGGWDITVSVQRAGQKALQEKFTITAK